MPARSARPVRDVVFVDVVDDIDGQLCKPTSRHEFIVRGIHRSGGRRDARHRQQASINVLGKHLAVARRGFVARLINAAIVETHQVGGLVILCLIASASGVATNTLMRIRPQIPIKVQTLECAHDGAVVAPHRISRHEVNGATTLVEARPARRVVVPATVAQYSC